MYHLKDIKQCEAFLILKIDQEMFMYDKLKQTFSYFLLKIFQSNFHNRFSIKKLANKSYIKIVI